MPDLDITQYEVSGKLGRHLVLDERSLAYRRPYRGEPIKPAEWAPKVPVLNQGDLLDQGIHTSELFEGVDDVAALGSCGGNSGTEAVSVLHDAATLLEAGLDVSDPVAAEKWSIGLYSDGTHRDQWHDVAYPSTDCGTSGLGIAKALRGRGLIDQYGHATNALEFCRDLGHGPFMMGTAWPRAWFEPVTAAALLDDIPNWENSPIAGGHEICVTALEDVAFDKTGALIYERTIIRLRNHWSASWGDQGEFRMSLALYQQMRHSIDLIQPRLDANRR